MKNFTLNDGNKIPALGLGTWKSQAGDAYQAVKEALRLGYRHIDAAWIYQNEAEVGQGLHEAIAEGFVKRQDVFVTSKLWNSFHDPKDVEHGCRESLDALGLDYIDLYLMHWPVAFRPETVMPQSPDDFWPLSSLPLSKTFNAMLKLKALGLVKSVGVSNFSVKKLDQLIAESGVVPAVNQVELHPYNPQVELLDYCRDHGIHLTAYSPLGSGDRPESMKAQNEPPLLENANINEIAVSAGLSPAQILLAWAIDRGTSTIPKSTNPNRIAENLAAQAYALSDADRSKLDNIGIQFRYVSPQQWFIPGVTYQSDDFWD